MIVLDENIPADEVNQLRHWHIHPKQIGTDLGRFGLQDRNEIIPLLHRLRRATLFTRDLGFYDPDLRHPNYSIVCLDVKRSEVAQYARRFLRHRDFITAAKRMGSVIRLTPNSIFCWRLNSERRAKLGW